MADLDYTNIAGSPFQPYVATQIEKRKKLVDNENRSSQELQWLTNKNVWIRVSSGANVLYGNKRFGGLEGDALSKKYILAELLKTFDYFCTVNHWHLSDYLPYFKKNEKLTKKFLPIRWDLLNLE